MTLHISKNKRSFKQVWCFLSEQIGECHLAVNNSATSLNDFLLPQQGFIKQVMQEVYKRNQCSNLNSLLNIDTTFDVLGEKAAELKQTKKDDLADIELLEEIGWHLQQRYLLNKKTNQKKDNETAKIISLSSVKTKIQNSRF